MQRFALGSIKGLKYEAFLDFPKGVFDGLPSS